MMSILPPLLAGVPLLGGCALLAGRRLGLRDRIGEQIGLSLAFVTFSISLLCLTTGQPPANLSDAEASGILPYLTFAPEWLQLELPAALATSESGWQLSLGLDGLGLALVMLTTIVTCAVLLVAQTTIEQNRSDFAAWTLVTAGGLLLAFTAMDLVLFYIGFELTLFPVFALIYSWGSTSGPAAAKRFVLYTLAGSIPLLVGLLWIAQLYSEGQDWTVSMPELSSRAALVSHSASTAMSQYGIFAFLVLGLGIKMAVLPLHTWLPTTYAAAHPTCSAFLAAVVLKLGVFGFLRLALPMVPLACADYGSVVLGTLGAIAIVYGALAALAQRDLRLVLAYSSVSHVGFITLSLFALNEVGISGATLQMFNHGLTTAAMFLLAACVIARRGTPMLDEGPCGLAGPFPRLAVFMIFFVVAGAGLPGLNNFVGETMALTAMLMRFPWLASIGILGVVLGAWYSFRLSQWLLFGKNEPQRLATKDQARSDLSATEQSVFAAMALLSLSIGVLPQAAVDLVRDDARRLSNVCATAMETNSNAAGNNARREPVRQLINHSSTLVRRK